jgi:uncharacterized protein (DUF433 family)
MMSNVTELTLPEAETVAPVVIETDYGPCLAHRRALTIYPIFQYLEQGCSHERIRQDFELSTEELDALLRYLAAHQTAVERDYAAIVRRSEALQERYALPNQRSSSFSPEMTLTEMNKVLHRKLAEKAPASLPQYESSCAA